MWNIFKVNNKDTKTTFEQVNGDWVIGSVHYFWHIKCKIFVQLDYCIVFPFKESLFAGEQNCWRLLVSKTFEDLLLSLNFMMSRFKMNTAKNTVISPNFLVWKFCGKAQFLHSFGQITVFFSMKQTWIESDVRTWGIYCPSCHRM